MNDWIDDLADLTAAGERVVVVTVAGIRGSAPREVGAKMIVTAADTLGTIGGGQLEYQCTNIACDMLGDDASRIMRTFPLGTSMGQCCGGVVDVLFEPMASGLPSWLRDLRALHGQREPAVICTDLSDTADKFIITAAGAFGLVDGDTVSVIVKRARDSLASGQPAQRDDDWFLEPVVGSDLNIAVFGAGHVGSAVVRCMSALDSNIRWIDSRRDVFRQVPANVRAVETADPALEVAAMPAQSFYLVMTHNHAIDFDVCDRILRRRDAVYCGLIGSLSKRRRFEKRYRQQGMAQSMIDSLICPIGVDGISGKKPAEIAVATAAEILKIRDRAAAHVVAEFSDNVHPLRG